MIYNIIKSTKGFTLVEIAIVLLVVTILLGYTMAMVPVQQELKQYRAADAEMNKITDALYGFAQVNGYLPCPAWVDSLTAPTVNSNGLECRDDNGTAADCDNSPPESDKSCDVWYGYVPGKTLGIEGKYSAVTGLLLDPWGKPYRYQVAEDNNPVNGSSGDGNFVISGDMNKAGIATGGLDPDLAVCNADPSSGSQGNDDGGDCSVAQRIIVHAPVVILSTGKDVNDKNDSSNSWIQRENLDNSTSDTVFVKTTRNDSSGAEFDDLVKWISPNILYSKMIEAGQLP